VCRNGTGDTTHFRGIAGWFNPHYQKTRVAALLQVHFLLWRGRATMHTATTLPGLAALGYAETVHLDGR
jgi:hypothetical protein